MSRWKDLRTYREVNPYTGNPVDEDAPANATGVNVAGTGDDSSVVVVRKKKKTLIDAELKVTNYTNRDYKRLVNKERKEKVDSHKRLNRIQVCLPERDI